MTTSAGYLYQFLTPLSQPHALSWPTSQRPANQSLHTRVDISHIISPCPLPCSRSFRTGPRTSRGKGILLPRCHRCTPSPDPSFGQWGGDPRVAVAVIFSIGLPMEKATALATEKTTSLVLQWMMASHPGINKLLSCHTWNCHTRSIIGASLDNFLVTWSPLFSQTSANDVGDLRLGSPWHPVAADSDVGSLGHPRSS